MKNKVNKLIKVINNDHPIDFFVGNYLDIFSLIQETLIINNYEEEEEKEQYDDNTLEMDNFDIEKIYDGGEEFYKFLQKMKMYEDIIPNILKEKHNSKNYIFLSFGIFCSINNFQRSVYICKENYRNFINFSNSLLKALEEENLHKKIMENYFYYCKHENEKLYKEMEKQITNNFKFLENLQTNSIDEQVNLIEMIYEEAPQEIKEQNKKIMKQTKETINLYLLGIVISHFYFQNLLNNIVFKEENKEYFKN